MKIRITSTIILLFMGLSILSGQQERGVVELSLQSAQDYAVANNRAVISSKLSRDASKHELWEAISGGLPQLNGSASLNDNLKLMTTLLPGEFFGTPGVKIPVQFGSKYNSSYGVQASMLIFNAPYLVGIQAAKVAKRMSEDNVLISEKDVKEDIISTYYLILISEESIRILEGNIAVIEESLKSTKAMYSVGMAEATDVDQIEINLATGMNTLASMQRTQEVSYNLLRLQLGLSLDTEVKLTEGLKEIKASLNVDELYNERFIIEENLNFKMVKAQKELSELNLKGQKASTLPTLSGFYAYSESGMGDKLNDLSWFPNSMVGLQLSVPIFASGQRYSKIKQAQIGVMQAKLSVDDVADALLLQEKQLRYNLRNANDQYKLAEGNVALAKKVYTSTENKFKQGMVSSLELTMANNNYLMAENSYLSALMNLLQTKLSLDKLLNNL